MADFRRWIPSGYQADISCVRDVTSRAHSGMSWDPEQQTEGIRFQGRDWLSHLVVREETEPVTGNPSKSLLGLLQ